MRFGVPSLGSPFARMHRLATLFWDFHSVRRGQIEIPATTHSRDCCFGSSHPLRQQRLPEIQRHRPTSIQVQQGYVDAQGEMIYYEIIGHGPPLMIVHGGPGASHDYFLPYLLPLARQNRLIFIDERGSGRSEKLDDPSGYTVENMVEDVEAVRQELGLGKVSLLGHSYGGVLAQAYALKYQQNLTHLILASTFASTSGINEVFVLMKQRMSPEVRDRINQFEAQGLFGHGKPWERRPLHGGLHERSLGRRLLSLSLPASSRSQLRPGRAGRHVLGPLPRDVGIAR